MSAELAKLPGVLGVDVDLSSGMVRISTREPLAGATVRAAVGAAGYEVEQ